MELRVVLLLLLAGFLSGCALGVSHPRALKPVTGFAPLASDPRVWVEPGFEAYGERVAQALPEAIIRHEQRELLEDAARYRWIRDNRHAQVVAIRSAIAFSGLDHEFDDDIDRLRGRSAAT